MSNVPQPTARQLFYDLCVVYGLDDNALQELANRAGIPKSVVDNMFVSVMVPRAEAQKVLDAFGAMTAHVWSLENVKVAITPTFAELCTTYEFDRSHLAVIADISSTIIDAMLAGHPVSSQDARLVLQRVSQMAGQHWDLETVDIPISDEAEGSHG